MLYLSDMMFFRINEDAKEFIILAQDVATDLPICIRPKLEWKVSYL
jgi:hypothetical protein